MLDTLRTRLTGELDALREKNLYRRLRVVDGQQKAVCVIDGKEVINLSSNNYLDSTTHPYLSGRPRRRCASTASAAARCAPSSARCACTRSSSAAWPRSRRWRRTSTFQSGFTANTGTIPGADQARRRDHLRRAESRVASSTASASQSRSAIVFRHSDMNTWKISSRRRRAPTCAWSSPTACSAWTATSRALPEIVRPGRALRRDHVWSTMRTPAACSARTAAARVNHFGLHGRVDIQVGTLSKAIGALGGYVAGAAELSSADPPRAPVPLRASHPPGVVATCLAAIDVLENEPRADRPAVGERPVLQGGPEPPRLRHGRTARRRSRR